jgi:NADH:ubiquinone oxidoreductase subunit F (NADH-binding)
MRPVVVPGPWLLRSPDPGLGTHRSLYRPLPAPGAEELALVAETAALRGRGGAAFPFATKLRTVAGLRGRKHVVVNLSEGEPASAKDAALVLTAPHLVLDGAELVARALGVGEVHHAVPAERGWIAGCLERALAERRPAGRRRFSWRFHEVAARFVSGEASAVTELVSGRTNLPVTSWVPTAYAGVRGQPTLLSNAETFAQLAALVLDQDPAVNDRRSSARLLSVNRAPGPVQVVEVWDGTPWAEVLDPGQLERPVLLGGYHGTWVAAGALRGRRVTGADLTELGSALGAGVVIPLAEGECPVHRTNQIVAYLAGQSARRCGPCVRGLPALAAAFDDLTHGGTTGPVQELVGLVDGRGACAHPDGTARLVRSTMTTFAAEVAEHAQGSCGARAQVRAGAAR